ncbi:MAG: hypothetical protein IJ914_06830 [Prevotella sp.]|nr:hypothetical protein [Prevotella sp.]
MSIRKHLFTKSLMLFLSLAAIISCGHKSIDDQAEQDAEEYNKKFCPTPVVNFSRTDSVKFDRKTRTYTFYCSLVDKADNEELINANREQLTHTLTQTTKQTPGMKKFIDAGIKFKFICRSGSNPQKILLVAE